MQGRSQEEYQVLVLGNLGLFSDDEEPGGGTDSRWGGQRRGDDKSRVGPAGLEMPV